MFPVEAIVLFDYAAQEPDELTLKKGDIITRIQVKDGGWWEGTVGKDGKRGLFPDNFIKVISDDVNSNSAGGAPLRGKRFKVKYNYTPKHPDELALQVNDIIEGITEVEEGWWEGKLGTQVGVFPSNFVTEYTETAELPLEKNSHKSSLYINPLSADTGKTDADEKVVPSKVPSSTTTNDGPVLPPKPKQVKEMCVALYAYEAEHEDELSLKENDVITLLSTDLPDKGWWKGQLNGKIGIFPDNFVKLMPISDEVSKPDRPQSATKTSSARLSDSVPKQKNSSVAALRKSLETAATVKSDETTLNVVATSKKPVVLKKPSFGQDNSVKSGPPFQLTQSIEKDIPSPEKRNNTSVVTKTEPAEKPAESPTTSLRAKLEKRSSFEEKLINAIINNAPPPKEADSPDGLSSSKVYKVSSASGNDHQFSRNGSDEILSKAENIGGPEKDVDLNAIRRSELLSQLTTSRAKAPKRRPPSGINFKEEEINSVSHRSDETLKNIVTVNGATNLAQDQAKMAAPWLQELKQSQTKKNSTQVNLKGGFTSTGCNVTFRYQRPVSMFSGETDNIPYSFHPPKVVPAPAANNSELTTTVGTAAASNVVTVAEKSDKVVTITRGEWNALNEKVNTLEARLEQQNEIFRKTVEQLKLKLANEIELRLEMKNEIDKLMDLVTQV